MKNIFDATTNPHGRGVKSGEGHVLPVPPEFDDTSDKQEGMGEHTLLPIHLNAYHLGERGGQRSRRTC